MLNDDHKHVKRLFKERRDPPVRVRSLDQPLPPIRDPTGLVVEPPDPRKSLRQLSDSR
jgi:hypothetical protein